MLNHFISPLSLIVLGTILAAVTRAFGCASCGSGGDTPVVLYPSENYKLYLGISTQRNFRTIDVAGNYHPSFGPDQREILMIAGAGRLTDRLFVTTGIPLQRSHRLGEELQQPGDLAMGLHFLPVLQNFAEPLIPQIQLSLGYKPAMAAGIQESTHPSQLDVGGSGFSEATATADLWFGITAFKFGFAQSFTLSEAGTFDGIVVKPGYRTRSTLTIGHDHPWQGKVVGGLHRQYQGATQINGVTQAGSELINYGTFATVDGSVTNRHKVSATLVRQARLFSNRNGSQMDQFTLAVQTLL